MLIFRMDFAQLYPFHSNRALWQNTDAAIVVSARPWGAAPPQAGRAHGAGWPRCQQHPLAEQARSGWLPPAPAPAAPPEEAGAPGWHCSAPAARLNPA